MKKTLLAAVVAGGLSAGGVISTVAQAAPLLGNGNAALGLVGEATTAVSPIVTPVVGNDGIQGTLLPILITGQNVLAQVQSVEILNSLLGDALQPTLGIVVPAAAPVVVGLITVDPNLIAAGSLATGSAVVGELVPALLDFGSSGSLGGGDVLGGGLLGGLLGGGDLLGGNLPGVGLLGGILGGGVPGADLLGGVLGGSLPGLDLLGGILGGGLLGV